MNSTLQSAFGLVSLAVIVGLGYLTVHLIVPGLLRAILSVFGIRPRMTPMMERRITRFKSLRRGYFSFLLITTLFGTSLYLELLINKRPLLIVTPDRWDCPALKDWYPARALGFHPYARSSDFLLHAGGDAPVDYRQFVRFAREPDLVLEKVQAAQNALAEREAALKDAGKPAEPAPPPKPAHPGPDATPEQIEDWEFAVEDWEFMVEDFEASKAEVMKAYQEKLKIYELRLQGVEEYRQELAQLKSSHETFASGKAWALMPVYPYSPDEARLDIPGEPPHAPSLEKGCLLGVTDNGLDVLCQLVFGFRISIVFALIVASIGYTIGILVGGAMGYYGGWFDILVQRFIEVWSAIPFLYTMMIIASITQPDVFKLALMLIVLRSWLGITFTIRGEFYREKAKDYVQAATSIGVSDWTIITRHILPNSLVPVVTFAPFGIVAYISTLVSLDFIGFGLPPGTPSWGYLMQQGQEHMILYPSLIIIPIVAFSATLFCVVSIGEAVREGFDPKVFSRLR